MAQLVAEVVRTRVIYERGVDPRELSNRRYILLLRERIAEALRTEGADDGLVPVLDEYEPVGSTDRIAFSTGKPCEAATKSHLSHAVCDSGLEARLAHVLENRPEVVAYAKNDRLFLEIPYRYLGKPAKYRPDFIVRLADGTTTLIEGKGRADEKDDSKATAARRWVDAVNAWQKLGQWDHRVCYSEDELIAYLRDRQAATAAV
jgi:type III restriction enzyme